MVLLRIFSFVGERKYLRIRKANLRIKRLKEVVNRFPNSSVGRLRSRDWEGNVTRIGELKTETSGRSDSFRDDQKDDEHHREWWSVLRSWSPLFDSESQSRREATKEEGFLTRSSEPTEKSRDHCEVRAQI